jgi:hypothetical protein
VTNTGDQSGEEIQPTQISELPETERHVLAALAIVGRASLSADELAELTEVDDVAPLLADLEQRGLIRGKEKQRYSAVERVGEDIRKTDDALSTGERLLQYMTTLAKGGQLTPERLLDDAEAVLGLSEWAAEMRQWKRLLELVKTLQSCFELARRVEQWLALLHHGLEAARALGDRQSELWMLQRLAAASASAGDPSAKRRYLREAEELRRRHGLSPHDATSNEGMPNGQIDGGTSAGGRAADILRRGTGRVALWRLSLVAVAAVAAGGATGYAIGNSSEANAGSTVKRVPVTVTADGHTVRTYETVTLPTRTVLGTKTAVRTVTVPPNPATVTTPPTTVTVPPNPATVTTPPTTVTVPPNPATVTVTEPPPSDR